MSLFRRNVLGIGAVLVLCAVLGGRLWQRQHQFRAAEAARPAAPLPVPAAERPRGSGGRWVPTVTLAAGAKARFADARFTNRLRNTAASADELVHNDHAILLRNAFVDTASGEPLAVPGRLRAAGDAGAYIVHAAGGITPKFRGELLAAGATILAYIPNNSYLVTADLGAAGRIAALPDAQTLVYEPYFKLAPELLPLALAESYPTESLKLILTVPDVAVTGPQIAALGGREVFRERGPFGTLLTVEVPGSGLVPLARLPGVQLVERWHPAMLANDRTGPVLGSTTDELNTTPYQNLTGKGVLINLNDTGTDATHPDLQGRVFTVPGAPPDLLTDPDGHGTHVAGILAGNGNAGAFGTPPQGSLTNANYRGRASEAELFVLPVDLLQGPPSGDIYLQETAAGSTHRKNPRTEPLISNNSWSYQTFEYDSHSASYDAAVRDALPAEPGDQPVLYVFSAGNSGFGGDNGQGGGFDSVNSPGNAKNAITVGALESARGLTNAIVTVNYTNTDGLLTNVIVRVGSTTTPGGAGYWPPDPTNTANSYETNLPYTALTDSDYQVASYSSRGNVGIGTEGEAGRFKPDVIAPGTFIISDRSARWQLTNDYPPDLFYIDHLLQVDLVAETAPAYRYETGTSMSAPAVAGLLAQMQGFFQDQTAVRRPSAAGYKALLLNSAQATSPTYYPDPHQPGNYGGWGLPNLPRALTGQLTRNGRPLYVIEADEAGQPVGLATGEARSYRVTVDPAVTSRLRLALVWTDPAGNPAGAAKLVNDLDLVVSNEITGEVIYGNDFDPGQGVNKVQKTNDLTRFDRLNNVERIILPTDPESTNLTSYVISVIAHRVNVNARTDHTNDIVQDFALAIAADLVLDAGVAAGGDVTDVAAGAPILPLPGAGAQRFTGVTNGGALFNERAGANSPLINGRLGQSNQWHFYTFTNSPFTNLNVFSITNDATDQPVTNYLINGSNVAFVTFPFNAQGNLSLARSDEADIDLYVSRDPLLLELDPGAVRLAFKSTSRGATELVFFTNSPVQGEVYYVGVKSEDQQAVEYGFVGLSTDQPFNTVDPLGVSHVLTIPLRQPIPDGTPRRPGLGLYLAISTLPGEIRGVRARVTTQGQSFLDLLGNLTHGRRAAVLNNHGQLRHLDQGRVTVSYDDTRSGADRNSVLTDGPGSLITFLGESGTGPWFLATSDNALGNTSRINYLDLGLMPNDFGEKLVPRCVNPGFITLEVINVPADASKLTITVTNMMPALPLEVFIKRDEFPDLDNPANNDLHATIRPPGGDLVLSTRDIPPLQAGRYFIAVFNPNALEVCYLTGGRIERNLDPSFTKTFTSGSHGLTDRSVSLSTIVVDDPRPITSITVGLRLDHPRQSDLAVRLINPQAARALLVENRGQTNGQGFGVEQIITNREYAHVALTFEKAAGLDSICTLYVNGLGVASKVLTGYVPVTTNGLTFALDPSGQLEPHPSIALDDFGLWRRALKPSAVLSLYRSGREATGRSVFDAEAGLVTLWPFDGNGADLLGTDQVVLGGAAVPEPQGQIQGAIRFDAGAGGLVAPSETNDVARYPGFTLEGWFKTATNAPTLVAGWEQTGGVLGLALYANLAPPWGHGGGSVSLLLTNYGALPADPGQFTLASPPNLFQADRQITNTLYAQFTDSTDRATQLIKFAEPPFVTDLRRRLAAVSGFDTNLSGFYPNGVMVDGWTVIGDGVQLLIDPDQALTLGGFLALKSNQISRLLPTTPGRFYTASVGVMRPRTTTNEVGLQVLTNGVLAATFAATDAWQTNAFSFLATADSITIDLKDAPGAPVLLDDFLLLDDFRFIEESRGLYLPEEPLAGLYGGPGTGAWGLEVTDGRGGAVGNLLNWQLTLIFAPTNPPAITLTNLLAYTNTVLGNEIKYFIVDVPPEVTHVTNLLASLTGGPLNLLYDQNGIPDGTRPEDYILLQNVISPVLGDNAATLTTNLPPTFQPGRRYYLGVQNAVPNAPAEFAIRVDFDLNIIPLTNNVPAMATNANLGFIDYYSYEVTNSVQGVLFTLTNLTGDVNLVARRAPSLPSRTAFDLASINVGLAPEAILVFAPGSTNLLAPGRWLLGVYAVDPALPPRPIGYTITASEIPLPVALTNIVALTDMLGRDEVLTNGSGAAYYYFDLTNEVTDLSFTLSNLGGDVDLFLRRGFPLPTSTSFAYASTNAGVANEFVRIVSAGPDVAVPRGRWFLAVVPVDPLPVSYTVRVATGGSIVSLEDIFDGFPVTSSHQPGEPSRFFRFNAPLNTTGILLEIYDLSGQADLYAAKRVLPAQATQVFSDLQPGTRPELVVLRTNDVTSDLADTYLLEVRFPVTETRRVDFTVRAATRTGGILESGRPLVSEFLPPAVPDGPFIARFNSVPGESYEFEFTDDLSPSIINWTPLPPPVTATGTVTSLDVPALAVRGVSALFYRVRQVTPP